MKDRHRQQWEALGHSDPYWAVLAYPTKKGGKWNSQEFFQTGAEEINRVLSRIANHGIQMRFGTVMDFGCGVGRLSRALSRYFEHVIAVDISKSMLEEARAANGEYTNIEFLHNIGEDIATARSESVDFIYSNIVLQQIPARRQEALIREFCRILRRGAVLASSTPAVTWAPPGYIHLLGRL